MNYYDLVLGLIPLTVVGVVGVLTAIGIEMSLAVPAGAMVTIPLIGHAMFVRAPGQSARTSDRTVAPRESRQAEQAGMNAAD